MVTPRAQNPALAAGLTVLAAAFAAGTTLLAKALGTGVLGPDMHALQISFGRFLFALMTISCAVAVLRPKFTRPHLGLHAGRSALGWGGVTLMFAAAAFIPLSDATAISFLNPVFGMLLAIPLLGEKVGPVRWGAALIALAGAAVLTRPGSEAIELGAVLALCSALCLGAELILIKRLSSREGPLQILIYKQRDRPLHRRVCRQCRLAGPNPDAMGGACWHRRAHGRGAGLFRQRHGEGGCQFCCAVFLCRIGFCRDL